MQQLKLTKEAVEEFAGSYHKLLIEVLALNIELSNDEIVESLKNLFHGLIAISDDPLNEMRNDPEFQQKSLEFFNSLELDTTNEDSEAAGI